MSDASADYSFKIVVVGNSGVGKSQLAARYSRGTFSEDPKATIGVDFAHKTLDINGKTVHAQLWDTAGQERFRSVMPKYYQGTHGALLVYSITDRESFDGCEKWLSEIREKSECKVIMLVGNKCDLEDDRTVATAEAQSWAENNGLMFMETSAKSTTNVDKAFKQVIQDIFDQEVSTVVEDAETKKPAPTTGVVIGSQPDAQPQGGCRC